MQEHIIEYLNLFRKINDQDETLILNSFKKVQYKIGEHLSKPGEITSKLFFINKGILKITIPDEEERLITYFFLKEHQFMSFLYSLYGGLPTEQGLQAACGVEVLVIEKKGLLALYLEVPYLKELIDKIAYLAMVDMIKMKNSYLAGGSLKRYELFLKNQPEVALNVMQIDIASYLGIAPQSLSRIRKKIS